MSNPFLTAHWKNLLNLTYRVPPKLLESHCPAGVELEVQDGSSFVSVVGFDFMDTRVWGIRWPGYRNFPELNLRYYVRCNGEPAVVFIREFVPRRFIAWMARRLYNEPYERAPMTSELQLDDDELRYQLNVERGGGAHRLEVVADANSTQVPGEETPQHFFKEHTWGFGTDHEGRTRRYRVDHPRWATYGIKALDIDIDFEVLYGEHWAFLNDVEPVHQIFAQGSDVTVYPAQDM